jgi:hypothetical protein
VKNGVGEKDSFPGIDESRNVPRRAIGANRVLKTETRFECHIRVHRTIQETVFAQVGT